MHKAIRRLAPAPGARRAHVDAAAIAGTAIAARKTVDGAAMIDVMDEGEPSSPKVGSLGALSDNAEQQPKLAVFMKRSGSVGADGVPDPNLIPVRASLDQMKPQLRLGPANRAAHPRSTRKDVFKIKQGLGQAIKEPRQSTDSQGQESTPLLSSSQTGDDKDKYGVHGNANGKANGQSKK